MKILYVAPPIPVASPPVSKPFQLSCSRCKTIVEVVKTELVEFNDRGSSYGRGVTCPTCSCGIVDCQANRKIAADTLAKIAVDKLRVALDNSNRENTATSQESGCYNHGIDYDH